MHAALRTTSMCRRCCCRLILLRLTVDALHSSQHHTSHAALRQPVRLTSTANTAGSQTALSFTRHLSASAPPVMTNTPEYLNLARELALLSDENFAARLFRFSRLNFNVAERPLVHCHLCELRQRRVLRLSIRTLFNFLHLAHVAGFHELCLEIYYAKIRQSEGSSTQDTLSSATAASTYYTSDNDATSPLVSVSDSKAMGQASISSSGADFSLTEHVVDSAYALGRSDALRALAADCAQRLARRYNVTITSGSTSSSVGGSVSYAIRDSGVVALEPRDMTSEFALLRALWRLVCLAEYWKERAMTHGQHTAKEAAERTLEDAAVVYEKYILASHALPAPREQNTTTTTTITSAAMSTEAMLGRIARLVRYDTSGDEGEMYFFQLCIQLGLLRVTRSSSAPQLSSSSSFTLPESGGSEKDSVAVMSSITSSTADTALAVSEVPLIHSTSEIGEAQLFYAALIATCAAGRHVDAALRYFESVCDLLQQQQQQQGGELVNSNGLDGTNCEKEGTSATASSTVLSYGAASSLFRPTSTAVSTSPSARQASLLLSSVLSRVADYVLYRLLLILQAARDNTRVVALGRALLGAGVRPTVSLWTLLLLSAGELREQRIALEAYNTAIDHLRHCGNNSNGSESVNEVSRLPMPEEVNEMNMMMIRTKATSSTTSKSGERRNWEYLLQTALNALSKCQLPRFEEDFLGPVRRAGWLRCTDEFYFCCLLQDAFNATTPLTRANAVVDRMAAQEVPLTEMIVSRLLRIYLRCEAPAFLPTYKLAVHERKLYRGVWLDHLLLWADRRRYFLTQDERRFILNEVSRSVGKGNCISTPADARTNNSSEEQKSAEDVTSTDLTGLRRGLQGLRTQLALLEYDYKVQPRDYFIQYHRPALPAPTLFDSRIHFLLRRPHCVRRGLSEVSIPTTEGEARRVRALAEMANLTAQLTIVPQDSADVVIKKEKKEDEERATMTRWREAAMRVYLTQLVQGMQRSCNAVI